MALRGISNLRPHLVLEEHICAFFSQKHFEKRVRREKARVLEIVGDLCKSLHACSRSCKKEEGKRLRLQVQGDLRQEPNPRFL